MAWGDRLRSALRSVGRFISGAPPEPEPEPQYYPDEPERYTPPPSDFGDYEDLPDEEDVYETPDFDEYYDREIELRDANGTYIGSMTKEEWFDLVAQNPQEVLLLEYGYNNIDIIDALTYAGEWDDYDWETWREIYDNI